MILAGLLSVAFQSPKFTFVKSGTATVGAFLVETKEDLSAPAVVVKGNNITLDFKGFVLSGTKGTVDPDQRKGLGVKVLGKNITIKNLTVKGYKVAMIAENCENLKLIDCNFSHNWKQKLGSTPQQEDLTDWMSFHQNEKDEWLRYGAGAYFKNVQGFEVKGLTVIGGQCGLMLMKSNKGLVWNSNLSYLSGVGLGMYRSSQNRVMHNNIDYCVRGYSHGVYQRGQDSAGILVYEQSNKNTFAYNSVTHSGDGFFLWAGQSTMDTGEGGCNDNIVYGNDFSFAPTNGIEATFSRNQFVNNRIKECWHGFWTGYSFDSVISANLISDCEIGIAHEHGQKNKIEENSFSNNKTDIRIWANEKQDPNWGYPKKKDTRSRDWIISGNNFYSQTTALDVKRTEGVIFDKNTTFNSKFAVDANSKNIKIIDNCLHCKTKDAGIPANVESSKNRVEEMPDKLGANAWDPKDDEGIYDVSPKRMVGGKWPFLKPNEGGRKTIIVDQWGPYDGLSPKLVDTGVIEDGWKKLSILGPKGKWKVKTISGMESKSKSGDVPGSIWVKNTATVPAKNLLLEYTGAKVTDYRGLTTAAGVPVTFGYQDFEVDISWVVSFFNWDKESDPRTSLGKYREKSKNPYSFLRRRKLDFTGPAAYPGDSKNYVGMTADGEFTVDSGDYIISTTSDDGVRVYLDGALIIDQWKYQGPTKYEVQVRLGGNHKIRVEHFQIDGYATIRLEIKQPKLE
jgi:parallel beta-helix repeat protein